MLEKVILTFLNGSRHIWGIHSLSRIHAHDSTVHGIRSRLKLFSPLTPSQE